MQRKWLGIASVVMLAIFVFGAIGWAQVGDDPNTVSSSTMVFEGALTDNGDSTYSGTIPMIDENGTTYGDGESGFDVYARNGATAHFSDDTDAAITDHDGWPTWNPDTPDWYAYDLTFYEEDGQQKWAVRNHPGTDADHPWSSSPDSYPAKGVPMSGIMDWTNLYAEETDVGAYLPGAGTPKHDGWAAANGGGPATWDMDWSWGSEVVPLAFPGFDVDVVDLGSGKYRVTMTPADGRPAGVDPAGPVVNDRTGESYGTIQAAIDDAQPGDTILVAAGTYTLTEQLAINKNLTLVGPNAGVDPNTGTRGDEAVIDVSSFGIDITASNVTIDGFTIIGMPYGGSTNSDVNPTIAAEANCNYVTVQNCVFNTSPGALGKEAMVARPGTNHISFLNNAVNNYIYGITARGSGWGGSATLPDDGVTDLTVSGNTFNVGYVDTSNTIYGMGIQIQYGDNIVVTHNTINGPGTFESCTYDLINSIGIADFMSGYGAAGTVNYSNNDVTNCYVGIATFAGNGQISGNTVHSNNIGIQVGQNNAVYISTPAAGVAITGNDIENNIRGIWVQNFVPDGLAAHCNNIVGNTEYGVINEDPEDDVFNAEDNWWGDDSGPSGAGPGTGDAVSTNVDYDPWIRSSVAESTTETVTGGGTVTTPSGDASAVVTGDATVTVAKYDGNPASSGFGADEAGYVDVYVPDTSGVTEITINLHYDPAAVTNEASLILRWWNGTNWVKCSDQGVDTANYILWAKIRSNTVPTLAQLGGTIFGAGSGQPASVLWYEDFEYADQDAMVAAGWEFSTNSENLWHLTTEAHVPSLAYPKLTPFPSSNHAVWFGNEATGTYNEVSTGLESTLPPEVRAQRARVHAMSGLVGHPYGELTSPDINVSGQTSVKVSFDYFREVECYPQGTYDKTYVQVSFDEGPWQTIWSRSSENCWEPSNKVWSPASIEGIPVYGGEYWIPVAVPAGASNMRIRFVFDAVDNVANDYLGWLIDDLKVSAAGPAGLHFEESSLPEGFVNQAYSTTITAVGGAVGESGYFWRVISNSASSWLTVTPAPAGTTATLSGTPTAPGTYQLCIGVSDDRGDTYSQCYDIVVEQVISSSGVLFYDAFEGVQTKPWTYTGLWHETQNVPCVSPPYASPTHVYYYGKDATCNYATAGRNHGTLTSPDISVSGITPGSKLTIGWKYWREVESYGDGSYDKSSVDISFDGGNNWTQIWYDDSKQSQPMGGWHLVEATTDTAGNDIVVPAGASTLLVKFTFDTVDGYANNYIGWLIDDVKVVQQVEGVQPLVINTTCDDLPDGMVGTAYNAALSADGGALPYTWTWTAGQIAGLVLNADTGAITGTPTTAGTYQCEFQVEDAAGNKATLGPCSVDIAAAPSCPDTVLDQDFESGLGQWNVTGLWHVTNAGCAGNCNEITGKYAYFGQDAPTCNYATGARTLGYLTSPQFDVDSCITELLLEFHHYRQVESYSGAYDKTYVQISWDGGAWQTVWYRDSKDASPNCKDIVIGPIARAGDKLRVRFVFDSVDKLYNNYAGWAIDDVTVWNKDGAGAPNPTVGPLSNIEPQAVAPRDQISVLNIPNPVRDVHTTTFTVRGVGIEAIKIQIFDLDENLVYEEEVPGNELTWHTVNEYGEYLANGVYFYRALAKIDGEWIPTKFQKLVILR